MNNTSPKSGLTPYICVNNAEDMIEFYKKAFGARENHRFDVNGKIGHADLSIFGSTLMLSDSFPEMNVYSPVDYQGSPVTLHLYVDDADAVVARAVEAGATITRAVSDQFYGDRMGMIKDPSGHRWSIASHVEDLSQDEIRRRFGEHRGA